MRSILFRFDGSPAFARALREGDQELALPAGETVADGEWVLAIFEVGDKRRATASAARSLSRGPGLGSALAFERRDWERLVEFAEAASLQRMAVARSVPESTGRAAQPPLAPLLPLEPAVGRARVLLVDDEIEICETVSALLGAAGLVVDVVGNAEDALEPIGAGACDLVVLDGALPGMTGVELCRLIRSDPVRARLPVLFLSARSSSRDIVEAFASGADDYVTKPFRASELSARIFSLLRRARIAPASPA